MGAKAWLDAIASTTAGSDSGAGGNSCGAAAVSTAALSGSATGSWVGSANTGDGSGCASTGARSAAIGGTNAPSTCGREAVGRSATFAGSAATKESAAAVFDCTASGGSGSDASVLVKCGGCNEG